MWNRDSAYTPITRVSVCVLSISLYFLSWTHFEYNTEQNSFVLFSSAGVGRTGTYIALDALYREGQNNGKINVPMYVKTMRKDRMNMIQGEVSWMYNLNTHLLAFMLLILFMMTQKLFSFQTFTTFAINFLQVLNKKEICMSISVSHTIIYHFILKV